MGIKNADLLESKVSLRQLALEVVSTYDARLHDELCMLAFGQAVEKMRTALGAPDTVVSGKRSSEPETLPLELQAMTHISKVLGTLPVPARFRALMVIALALAPDVFSDREYGELFRRAKGQ